MSEFSNAKFSSDHYDHSRPTYPPGFIDVVLKYHGGPTDRAIDIGCGTGQMTFPLAKRFHHTIGVDPSEPMIRKCKAKSPLDNLEFHQGFAEKLDFVGTGTVDLATAAECVHWFDHDKYFKEMARILKPNGTLAYWCYADPVIVENISTGKGVDPDAYVDIYNKFTYNDPKYLGKYWEVPGRNILRRLYQDVKIPAGLFLDPAIELYDPRTSKTKTKLYIEKIWTLEDFKNYVKSWSAYHKYTDTHLDPELVADLMVKLFLEKLHILSSHQLRVVWQTGYYFMRRI